MAELASRSILGMRVHATSYDHAVACVTKWAYERRSVYVCAANVHMTMEAHDDPSYRNIVNQAALVTPDGMPLVWALRLLGVKKQERVYGPDLVLSLCVHAAEARIPIALYGGTPESLDRFSRFLTERFPQLTIACAIAPPFRPLTPEEDAEHTRQLARSGARIVLVGLGCPKQERWMAEHQGRIPAVMVGVGAAFDFFSGRVRQAPKWMQRIGMEWFFRLLMEPRRLWKRYLKHNPRFVLFFSLQFLGLRRYGISSS